MGKNILLTGSHRSGTTFTGKMLSIPKNIGFINEPFNPNIGIEGIDNWNVYVKEGISNEKYYENLVKDLLNGRASFKRIQKKDDSVFKKTARLFLKSGSHIEYIKSTRSNSVERYLLKDPIACMASEWLHNRFDMEVVMLIRHPAAFVASLKRLDWHFPLERLIEQRELFGDFLNSHLKNINLSSITTVERDAILWNCIHEVLFSYLHRNPAMISVKHEDLSINPIKEFEGLYNKLNIDFDSNVKKVIKTYTVSSNPTNPKNNLVHDLKRNSKDNIERWKKILSEEEIYNVRNITKDLAHYYYSNNEW
ncbi:sulfotransferase domain-containing protein [Halobacillus sp. BBL2006]|uniref:sulfotransferase domain-containing protein n=1 Tax=Halobacillus sp. BBL2006 TaxID=1543706 RepID=UPI000543B74B|nr:sulfotransferase domain-containing protein [Halobacillus sp. BBL2006]KHE71454.1 hypothetical protein LD39_09700 [Halobacillus sp. BBL2006]